MDKTILMTKAANGVFTAEEQQHISDALDVHERLAELASVPGLQAINWTAILTMLAPILTALASLIPGLGPIVAILPQIVPIINAILAILKLQPLPVPTPTPTPVPGGGGTIPVTPVQW